MDLCCNGLQCRQAQDATGLQCRRAGFSPACGTDATWVALACTRVTCASGHTAQLSIPGVLVLCARTWSEWLRSLGQIPPGQTPGEYCTLHGLPPHLSLILLNLWTGESACLYSDRMSCTVTAVGMCWLGPVIERCGGDPLRSQTEKQTSHVHSSRCTRSQPYSGGIKMGRAGSV